MNRKTTIWGGRTGFALAFVLLAAVALWATGARAQSYTAVVQPGLDIGTVSGAKTGDSIFRIDPSTGAVLRVTGTATRLSPTSVRALVTISCVDAGVPDSCANANVNVVVGPTGAPTGRAKPLSAFKVAMSTATLTTPATGTSPISFTIGPVGLGAGKTFYVGADFTLAGDNSGSPSGDSTAAFYVYVGKAPGAPTTGTVGTAGSRVLRALTISKTQDLVFGIIGKPNMGSGVVTFDASTGLRTATGGGALPPTPTPKLAAFNLTGEGGQMFSVSVQSSFVMSGPTPITVTTNTTAASLQTFNAALGSQGSFNFQVGGSFPYTSATQEGSYSGAFTVTADYN